MKCWNGIARVRLCAQEGLVSSLSSPLKCLWGTPKWDKLAFDLTYRFKLFIVLLIRMLH